MNKQLKTIIGIGILAGWMALPSAMARDEATRQSDRVYAEGVADKAKAVEEAGIAAENDIDSKKDALKNAKSQREPIYKKAILPVRSLTNKVRAKRIQSRDRKIARKETELTRREEALNKAKLDLEATEEEAEVSGARGKLGEKLEKRHNKARAKRVKKAQKKYDKAMKKRDKAASKIAKLKDKNSRASTKVADFAKEREDYAAVKAKIKTKREELTASRKAFNDMKPKLSAAEKVAKYSERVAELEELRKDAEHNLALPFSKTERDEIRKYKAEVDRELDGLLDDIALLHPVIDPNSAVAANEADVRVLEASAAVPLEKVVVEESPQIVSIGTTDQNDATVADTANLRTKIAVAEGQLQVDRFYRPDPERDEQTRMAIREMQSGLPSDAGSAKMGSP